MRPLLAQGTLPLRSVTLRAYSRAPLQRAWRSHPRRHQSSNHGKPPPETEQPIPVPNTVGQLPLWQRLGPLTTLATAYARAQRRRPWTTQFFSALVIYCISDISAQSIGSDDPLDPKRTARSLVIGGVAAIPSYLWFNFLSHNFNYSSRLLSLGTKIVVSQFVFAPTFNSYFFGMQALLSGCTPAEVVERIVNTVPTSWVSSCRFWPIVTAFSFTFVPVEHRSVFSAVIAIGWQTYLALLNRRAEEKAAAEAGTLDKPKAIEAA
ncbi:uncharacterized protein F5Z01DRAFT_330216 [Emericellopsis atlantica]|uniref:Uncharacterized protein n=1 Tax=Emericellopsis atlantica TaxID=2614577 RepID=A0A9P8CKY0_9HYPO|nr:uncharacterized protein F5Z01DRAFT_330216 [Emericellopsis atlantica]KAG9251054.1 hypothetical protein F5Z01DRAFT_330216 [Emericellopsis atlantica]